MISSMTAFARSTQQAAWGSLVWELRSVNHRYLEMNLRLPEAFRELEPKIRASVSDYCQRGKLDITLRYSAGEESKTELRLNQHLLMQLSQASSEVQAQLAHTTLDAARLLTWPGVVQTLDADLTTERTAALDLLQQALQELKQTRQREGDELKQFLQQRLDGIEEEAQAIQQHVPALLLAQREKLTARLADIQQQLDPTRLEQEMVIFAQRADITEELDRLQAHLKEAKRILKKGGAVGRRLDFLMQEFNREANTISSKINDIKVTQSAVELKVLIEQMREQVQNIE